MQPSHGATDSPNFTILVKDLTSNTSALNIAYSAYSAANSNLFRSVAGYVTTDWKVEEVNVTSGHDYQLVFLAADCSAGGHGGYVYVDGFGSTAPSPTTASTGYDPATDITHGAQIVGGGTPDIISSNNGLLNTQSGIGTSFNNRFDGGTLLLTSSGTVSSGFSITSNNGIIDQNGNSVEFSGVFSDAAGANGQLTITNTGTAGATVLSGTNTYTGGTAIGSGATLALSGTGSVAASSGVADAGTFDISATTTGASIKSLSGAGSVALGEKSLELTAAAGTFSGLVGGTGAVSVTGGTETLSGTNTYSGATSISSGATLALSGTGSVAASSGVADAGTFDISATTTGASIKSLSGAGSVALGEKSLELTAAAGTFSGLVGGTGAVSVTGGTETLLGANTYTGGTSISSDGTLIGNTTSLQGDIANSGALVFNQTSDGSYAGVISGTGTLTKTGDSLLTLTGANSSVGATTVTAGTLAVNGTLGGPVTVESGATLQGRGSINNSVLVYGAIAPGNSPGTLSVTGPVTMFAGSTMQTDIDGVGTANGAGNYDRLVISGSTGSFSVGSNVTLSLKLRGISGSADNTFTSSLGNSFRIVTADGGVSGRFSVVDQPASGLPADTRLYAFYNMFGNNSIDLRLIPTSWKNYLSLNGGNENAQSAGKVLDLLIASDSSASATLKQQELLYSVAGATGAQLPDLAAKLSGQVHAAMVAEIPRSSFLLQSTVSDVLGKSPLGGSSNSHADGVWFTASKNWDKWYGDETASAFRADRNQYILGRDLLSTKDSRIGVGYSHANIDITASYDEKGTVTQETAFLYGQQRTGRVVVEGVASVGSTLWKTTRPDPLKLSANELTTRESGVNSMAGLTLRIPTASRGISVQPYASALYLHNERGGLNEEAVTPAALSLSRYNLNGSRLIAGLSLGSEATNPASAPATFTVNLAGGFDSSKLSNAQVEAALGGTSYTILSPSVSQSFFKTTAGATLRVVKDGYCYLNYAGEFRSGAAAQGLEVGVKVLF